MTQCKNCYSCGRKEGLRKVTGVAKTEGFDVPIKGEFACEDCISKRKVLVRK